MSITFWLAQKEPKLFEIYLNCNCGLHWGSLQRSPDILAGLERSAWQQRRKGRMEREGKGRGGEEGWREKEGRRHCPLLQEFPREPVIQNPLPLLFPGEIFWFHIQNMFKHEYGLLFNLASDDSCRQYDSCRQSSTTVSGRRFAAGVVSCYIRSATLGICCSQSSVVLTSKSKRRCMGRLLFAVQNFCCLWIKY